ncbi:hypothetical protein ACFV4F_42010, partial [Kitasatospora sp. NPDC059722]|uniref:hypothetical protein n=1 Tax=Kitasatospora sp. NPDC059722 TaxID=3346925 RepID=UPI0036878A5B
ARSLAGLINGDTRTDPVAARPPVWDPHAGDVRGRPTQLVYSARGRAPAPRAPGPPRHRRRASRWWRGVRRAAGRCG